MSKFTNIDPKLAHHWIKVPGDWRKANSDKHYDILWDGSRAFGQLWPRPTGTEVATFYEVDEYYTHQSTSDRKESSASVLQRVQTKLSWLRDYGIEPDKNWWAKTLGDKTLRILEVGCGNGSNLSMFISLGHQVVGVEPDPSALEVARSLGHQVFQGTAENLPAEVLNDRFDAVVFMHVLEHCIDPSMAVANAVKLLKPGGQLVAEVPNNDCQGVKRFGELWYWLDVPRHLNFFTESSLRSLAVTSGLTVDGSCFSGYCRQFGESWKKAQVEIAKKFGAEGDKRIESKSYWFYLLETAWSSDNRKYDSVRVICSFS